MMDLVRLEAIPVFTLLGLVLASFGCVIADRWPAGQSIHGRSRCACGRALRVWQLVPVAGWLMARGRARCCDTRVPWRYPAAEAVLGAFGAADGCRLRADAHPGHWAVPLLGVAALLGLQFALLVFTCWTRPAGDQPAQ